MLRKYSLTEMLAWLWTVCVQIVRTSLRMHKRSMERRDWVQLKANFPEASQTGNLSTGEFTSLSVSFINIHT